MTEHDRNVAAHEAVDTALLSEPALAEDWNRLEEDKAWRHLQPVTPHAPKQETADGN